MTKSTTFAKARVQVAKARTTLHQAAGGRRVAAERNGRRGTPGAGCRSIIVVAVSVALSLGVAAAAWAVLPDDVRPPAKPVAKPVAKPEPKAEPGPKSAPRPEPRGRNSSKPAAGTEPPRPVTDHSQEGSARLAEPARKPGEIFRDCDQCPEMVVVPAGSFMMGSPETELYADEGPQHRVTFARPFAVGKYELTFDEWDACVADRGCNKYKPGDEGWRRGRQPVINVSWDDAQAYVAWLAKKTGKPYRLLSEAEWEYAARAGSPTAYPWGPNPGKDRANFDGSGSRWSGQQTAPVGSFAPNAFGLYDLIGNVWEWTQDCWNDSYAGAPKDGRPWLDGDCGRRVVRGGSWYGKPEVARAAYRNGYVPDYRLNHLGFRLARTL